MHSYRNSLETFKFWGNLKNSRVKLKEDIEKIDGVINTEVLSSEMVLFN